MNLRNQMTPGMKKCKEKYGKKKNSPYKEADASLVQGQKELSENAMDAVAGGKTGVENLTDIAQDQVDKYAGPGEVNFADYGYDSDEQIKENLSV